MATVNPQVLDSSALRGIQMPDIVGGIEKAYTLKSMMDVNQLNNLKMNAENRQLQDQETARNILKDSDLSTVDGAYKAAQKLTKAGMPKQGMDIVNTVQSVQSGRYELEDKQLKIHADTQTLLDQTVGSVLASIQPMAEAKKPDGSPMYERSIIDQNAQTALGNAISNLKNDKSLPEDVKNLALEQVKKYVGSGQPITFESLQKVYGTTKEGVAAIKAHMEQKKGIADLAHTESSTDLEKARLKSINAGGTEFGRADIKMMAEQYLAGDKSVFQNLGRGTQGTQAIRQLRMEVRQLAEERGMSGADIAAKMAEFEGFKAGERALGTSLANIEQASTEAGKMIDVARTASAQVPRASFVPWAKLVQKEQIMTDDTKLNAFAASTLAVVNTWARAINPKGVPTVSDKEHAYSILNTAKDQGAYGAILDQFETEIRASLEAPADVKQAMHDRFVGKQKASAPAPAVPAPGGANSVDKAGYDALPKGARYTMPGDPTVRVKQ